MFVKVCTNIPEIVETQLLWETLLICINLRWPPYMKKVSYLCSYKSDLSDLKFDFRVMGHQECVKMHYQSTGKLFE